MSYFSAAEEVCFGRCTPREAKRDARFVLTVENQKTAAENNSFDQCSEENHLITNLEASQKVPESEYTFFTALGSSGNEINLKDIEQTLVENSFVCDHSDFISVQEDDDNENGVVMTHFSPGNEVWWGPYTMREAKRDARNYTGRRISRRHSWPRVITTARQETTAEENGLNHFLEEEQPNTNLEISQTVPHPDCSSFFTALDSSAKSLDFKADPLSRITEVTEELTNTKLSENDLTTSVYDLNDTLDEINKFLEENEGSEENKPTIKSSTVKSGPPHTSKLPKAKSNLFLNPTPQYQPIFKAPITPKMKNTTPNSKVNNKKYVNILSPVGIYIRNTPTHIRNVIVKSAELTSISNSQASVSKIHKKEDVPNMLQDIPRAIYKPAKNQIEYSTKDANLPFSVKKMVPVEPSVISHQKKCYDGDEKKLRSKLELGMDLTRLNNSVDDQSICFKVQKFI